MLTSISRSSISLIKFVGPNSIITNLKSKTRVLQAEIITIGDELLIGMTVDTNSAWMATQLTSIGLRIYQITSVSDSRDHILKAIDDAMCRSELVLVTGGLGPTSDDITKQTLADYFDSGMVLNSGVYDNISRLLAARGLEMNENNRRQAMVPEKCIVLENSRGTAPGMLFERDSHLLVAMPGVPYEMEYLVTNHIVPLVKKRFKREAIVYRLVMTYGTFEAKLAELLEGFEANLPADISLAYLPTAGIIKLRLTARAEDEAAALEMINRQIDILKQIIPGYIYGYDGITMEEAVVASLRERGLTIATAESCTGGNIARMITSVPGSSACFTGSVVAYDNRVKVTELEVGQDLLYRYGAVSEEVVTAMADGIRKRFGTSLAVATTGIAGPDGGTAEKPVGTVWIAVSSEGGVKSARFSFGSQRQTNIRRSSLAALNMVREQIINS